MPLDTVYLENQSWTVVNVEAVIGNSLPADTNRSLGVRNLRQGENWRIDSNGEDIYYRRDADPSRPDGRMTLWTHRPCYGNGSVYHERI